MVCSNLIFGTGHNFPFKKKMGFICKNRPKKTFSILINHLKGLSLSIQKSIKGTLLGQRTKVMAVQI